MAEPPQNQPAPELRPLPTAMRWLLQAFAVLCLVLAAIGVVLPGMPTTVFVLMAGWAAARSSPRLHAWLWQHRLFGPMLRNWANGGCVSRRAKWSASVVMSLSAVILFLTHTPRWVPIGVTATMACVLCWLWLRPEP